MMIVLSLNHKPTVLSAISLSCICRANVSCSVLTYISCIFSDEVWLKIKTLKVFQSFPSAYIGSTGLLSKANNSVIYFVKPWELVNVLLMPGQIQFTVKSMLPRGTEDTRSTACRTEQTSSFKPPPTSRLFHTASSISSIHPSSSFSSPLLQANARLIFSTAPIFISQVGIITKSLDLHLRVRFPPLFFPSVNALLPAAI